ncbi:MAG: undecaprenyl/decaprenyl-phosphate alpha-N-acetylglucosaminyl 1-phosphate transferase [Syntrophomonadaceae bacterium]|nr:undecaprenyl/decaprenyl-phosphate alpha-N-acetylglucosaminyl 1-phosphate transferase [Syntrophomonadaceae bacterium]
MENTFPIYVPGVIIAFILAYLVMPVIIKLAFRIGAVDQPSARKVHSQPMPRLGGTGIFLAFVLVVVATVNVDRILMGILLGGTAVFLVGVLDDIYRLSPWAKLAAQIAAALIAVYCGVRVDVMTNPFDGVLQLGALSIPLTLLWIIGITNAVNLIDGLDGLAAGVCAIAAVTIGIVAWKGNQVVIAYVALVLTGAVLGFLPHNFHPARVFMGDSGSMFLGFVLACLSVSGLAKGATLISLCIPVIILGIPVFDTLFAIIRRVNNQKPIFGADKDHLHHRLMEMGMSHQMSVIVIYIVSALLGGAAVVMAYVSSPKALLVLAAVLILMIIGARRVGIIGRGSGIKERFPEEGRYSKRL